MKKKEKRIVIESRISTQDLKNYLPFNLVDLLVGLAPLILISLCCYLLVSAYLDTLSLNIFRIIFSAILLALAILLLIKLAHPDAKSKIRGILLIYPTFVQEYIKSNIIGYYGRLWLMRDGSMSVDVLREAIIPDQFNRYGLTIFFVKLGGWFKKSFIHPAGKYPYWSIKLDKKDFRESSMLYVLIKSPGGKNRLEIRPKRALEAFNQFMSELPYGEMPSLSRIFDHLQHRSKQLQRLQNVHDVSLHLCFEAAKRVRVGNDSFPEEDRQDLLSRIGSLFPEDDYRHRFFFPEGKKPEIEWRPSL